MKWPKSKPFDMLENRRVGVNKIAQHDCAAQKNLCKHRKGDIQMRYIAIALLALLVCTTVMAADIDYTTNYATASGSIDQWGVWKVVGGTWTLMRPAGTVLHNNFDVTAFVEIWERDTLNANKVDFHWGRTSIDGVVQPISVVLDGTVQANNDVTIDIWAPEGCNNLKVLEWQSGEFGDAGADIPLTWEYSEAGVAYSPCTFPDGNAKAVAFPSGFGVMAVDKTFHIKLTATPAALQADGSYKLDPIISVTPIL